MFILSASRPMVRPSSPSRLASSSATSRMAARVSSPLRMNLGREMDEGGVDDVSIIAVCLEKTPLMPAALSLFFLLKLLRAALNFLYERSYYYSLDDKCQTKNAAIDKLTIHVPVVVGQVHSCQIGRASCRER